ncbi:AraC family transcriptional regulator [Tardiphaga alba]|uniref:AraC family transcriptional regulator n=1 Tax=Tardiphaga alba TaxID=340268 RepID=UPI001BA92947|nr:AraC family transcriptional regulator [Tardiphaga alba]
MLITVGDETPVEVHAGQVVLFPGNDEHLLASAPGIAPVSAADLLGATSVSGSEPRRIRYGGGGDDTRMICGFLASEDAYSPLIATLPKTLMLDVREGTSGDWIEASLRFAASEFAAGRLAASSVMSRLSELLLVEAVRQYALTLREDEGGWLRGLRDPVIGRALALIHDSISTPMSAESLAKQVGLSRSAFMDRFTATVGQSPIRYQTALRLQAAKLHLKETGKTIGQLAHNVGYASEEAFSRAFKREFGLPPARWREQNSGINHSVDAIAT